MCGIVAIYCYRVNRTIVNKEELRRIRDYMTPRGPDGAGEWFSADDRVGLGHRRLSIIDISERGSQPMVDLKSGNIVTYNGEIYNYQELRSELESKGFSFRSGSDTEVLLKLYYEYGIEMVYKLRGMYAFAIWDNKKKGLFLARDPFGIKPLYYSDNGNTFKVASQVKALLKGDDIDRTPAPAGHVGFFLWGSVPEPYTLFKNIKMLPAGTYMWVDESGRHKIYKFCNISDILAESERSNYSIRQEEQGAFLHAALIDSIRHHLIADVPVGIFLSAGIDSSTLTALASESEISQLQTITLGFKEFQGTDDDETVLASLVSKRYNALHFIDCIERRDFLNEFEKLFKAMDQPSIDGVNTFFVSRAAAHNGLRVALSGLGGDELFGGYLSFHQIPKAVKILKPLRFLTRTGNLFRIMSAPLLNLVTSPKYAGIFQYGNNYEGAYLLRNGLYMPWELHKVLEAEMIRDGWEELQPLARLSDSMNNISEDNLKITALEMNWFMRNQLLRDADWAGMAHSVEIRVPLVDIELLRRVSPLLSMKTHPSKLDFAKTPQIPLPNEILLRKKTGFTVPVRKWLSENGEIYDNERGLRGWAKQVYSLYQKTI